jgi:hypothetical protein
VASPGRSGASGGTAVVPRGPFVTVSVFGAAERGVANGGADYGPDTPGTRTGGLDEAGLALKATGGGTVYVLGGIGSALVVRGPVTFYDTVNYVGDGVTLRAAPGLLNPFTTDPEHAYFSGTIAGLTLDGAGVPGTTVLTLVSTQQSTFADLVVRGAGVAPVPVANSPFTFTNGSNIPVLLELVGGAVTSVHSNGVAGGPTAGLFTILPGASLVVEFSIPPNLTQLGTGVLLTCSGSVAAHESLQKVCGGNTFASLYVTGCGAALHLSGLPTPVTEVTNNVFLNLEQDPMHTVGVAGAGVVLGNNCDSNNFYRAKLALGVQPNMTGVAVNTFAPNADVMIYQNTFSYLSVDASDAPGQVGIALGRNTSKPNRFDLYLPQPGLPVPVRFVSLMSHVLIRDQENALLHLRGSKGRTGFVWTNEKFPGSGAAFRNDDYFPMLLTIQGGSVRSIALNGQDLGMSSGTVLTKPGDSVTCVTLADPAVFRSLLTVG